MFVEERNKKKKKKKKKHIYIYIYIFFFFFFFFFGGGGEWGLGEGGGWRGSKNFIAWRISIVYRHCKTLLTLSNSELEGCFFRNSKQNYKLLFKKFG